jgi:AraC-like DNA-binding protein
MVELLYADEHLNCPNYDNKAHPAIEEIVLEQDQIWDNKPRVSKVVFILKGEMEYSTGKLQGQHAQKGQILFFPVGKEVHCRSLSDVNMLVIRIYDRIQLCDCFRIEDLYLLEDDKDKKESTEVKHSLLDVNPVMEKYLDMLMLCYQAGLRCRYYNEGKIRELMYIFRAYYPKNDLKQFFAPALSADTYFSRFIRTNYSKYGSLEELASAMNYTVSGLEKRFRKVFNCSPNKWIRQQKAQEAFHQINTSDMGFKQIADLFGFNSLPAFIRFIRRHFGMTPGEIREKRAKQQKAE